MVRRFYPRSGPRHPKKKKLPVQFEVTEQTKIALAAWLPFLRRNGGGYLLPIRREASQHLSTRQYARIRAAIGNVDQADASAYRTQSMGRTKAAQIYRNTGNLLAVQIR